MLGVDGLEAFLPEIRRCGLASFGVEDLSLLSWGMTTGPSQWARCIQWAAVEEMGSSELKHQDAVGQDAGKVYSH